MSKPVTDLPSGPGVLLSRPGPGTSGRNPPLAPRQLILLATSGSPASLRATVFAARLTAACDATLRIIHVLAPIEYRVGRLAPMRAVPRKLTDPFQSPVLRQAREVAWRNGAAATLALLAGDPAPEIVNAAAEMNADIIVIGNASPRYRCWRTAPTGRWIHDHAPCRVLTPEARHETALPPSSRQMGWAASRTSPQAGRRPRHAASDGPPVDGFDTTRTA